MGHSLWQRPPVVPNSPAAKDRQRQVSRSPPVHPPLIYEPVKPRDLYERSSLQQSRSNPVADVERAGCYHYTALTGRSWPKAPFTPPPPLSTPASLSPGCQKLGLI